jgi:phospholipase C
MIAVAGTAAGNLSIPTTTSTPVKHLIIIFQENLSFDHYFATYPHAMNGDNGSKFVGDPHTPSINDLSAALLFDNPNSANPFRLDPSQQRSCDITNSYTEEQKEYNGGLMNKFVQFSSPLFSYNPKDLGKCNPNQVIGYYDGIWICQVIYLKSEFCNHLTWYYLLGNKVFCRQFYTH